MVEINKIALTSIKVRRADRHKVISKERLSFIIESVRKHDGDLYDKATKLLKEIVKAHCFESGNRRTAILATEAFLKANGEELRIEFNAKILIGIREGFYTDFEIKEWLHGNAVREFKR